MKIDFDQIRELLAVFSQTDISELTIEAGEEKITVKKSAPVVAQSGSSISFETPSFMHSAVSTLPQTVPDAAVQQLQTVELDQPPPANNGLVPIASPMVGTFYRSPSPTSAPFVNLGDHITVGQTVCIIEAMKLMNDMPTEVAGRIVKVCVDNGTTVEYGQPLFLVDPAG